MDTFSQSLIAVFQTIPQSPTLKQIDFYRFLIPHLEELGNYLSATIPNSPSSSFEQFKVQLQQSVSDEEIYWVFTGLSHFFAGQGLYLSAEPLYLQAINILRERLGENHPNTQTCYQNYMIMLSQFPEAELRKRFPDEVVKMLKPKSRNLWKQKLLGLIQGVLRLLILPFYYVWLGLRWLVRRLLSLL
ncbi:tetratricopeptide repeat protein [Crocosphaera sp. XPORK-15E]|uniref:tetratricopeptide repeat protein n=1 Tax=Crocosphaera sp. XPORK-15E TaxID=3110247 RepID=UPI002B221990|nr:tetratricopeptide repeat protein [Crocosphaera sp. XPORK-15E]MEA5536304.1 tetratricopeptide repeat protein [Crocosphaera sp. XPORK-15E]